MRGTWPPQPPAWCTPSGTEGTTGSEFDNGGGGIVLCLQNPPHGMVKLGVASQNRTKTSERGGANRFILLLGALGWGSWFKFSLFVVCLFVCSRAGRQGLTPGDPLATHPDPPGDPFWFGICCLFVCLFVVVFLGGSPATRPDSPWATHPGRPALGDQPKATHSGRPRLGEPGWATHRGDPPLATHPRRPILAPPRSYQNQSQSMRVRSVFCVSSLNKLRRSLSIVSFVTNANV